SSETQKAIGTGVFGGMISATLLALVFVPIFFIIVMGTVDKFSKQKGSN
ncbi:efflux RND transporter permease subunit, partial [Acinetobacter baumannii]